MASNISSKSVLRILDPGASHVKKSTNILFSLYFTFEYNYLTERGTDFGPCPTNSPRTLRSSLQENILYSFLHFCTQWVDDRKCALVFVWFVLSSFWFGSWLSYSLREFTRPCSGVCFVWCDL